MNSKLHGESHKTKEWYAWTYMKKRCFDPNCINYNNYGGRGITVCEAWRNDYQQFLEDVGRAPSPIHTLDRIENNGNYEPGNVKWSTPKEQANNRRFTPKPAFKTITAFGETKKIVEWITDTRCVVGYKQLILRLWREWCPEDAITTLPRKWGGG